MDLYEVMRTTSGTREYDDREVPDEVLYRVLDNARFAPSGGNRQGWRVVVVRDAAQRRWLRDRYQQPWEEYKRARYGPPASWSDDRRRRTAEADAYADRLHDIPVHLLVWVDVTSIEATDADRDHPSVVAGGSIFPFVHNINLACRNEGLGARLTTLLAHRQDEIREEFGVPAGYALAAVMVVGYPKRLLTRLRRRPVESFATQGRFDGPPLAPASSTDGQAVPT